MSFLGDLIGSIGGERPPAPPTQSVRAPSRPASTNPPTPFNVSKSVPSTPSTARPVYKGTAGLGAPQQVGSLKRKADEISSERPKPSRLNSTDPTSSSLSNPPNGSSSQTAQNVTRPPAKAPARGSYAALMARAKDAQSSKAPSSIGIIKHQATEKDKVKMSKLAERKRQDQEKDKGKALITGQTSKTGANAKVDPRRRSASPVKKADIPKVARAPKPPLHGPRKEVAPAYKGTMGQAPRKFKDEVRTKSKSRYDEYLDTDEDEDEERYGYDDEPNEYYSDDSADMEAGYDDIDMEDRRALQAAKQDDAEEQALEAKLKREKEERKRKLAAMAKKHSR